MALGYRFGLRFRDPHAFYFQFVAGQHVDPNAFPLQGFAHMGNAPQPLGYETPNGCGFGFFLGAESEQVM